MMLYFALTVYYLVRILVLQYSPYSEEGNASFEIETKEESLLLQNSAVMGTDSISHDSNAHEIQTIKEARLSGIYKLILNYMEESQCYLNPDYTLDQLSIDMKINRIALSNSLNHIGRIPFKDMLNQYRIRKAKELFSEDTFSLNNIKQVYMSAGFKYHTTFNRVFKKHEGITPSEYIINMKQVKDHKE